MKTKIFIVIFVLTLSLNCLTSIFADDGFESVKCGADIPKALIGRKGKNEPAVKIEERHKDLQLKHLGADIISEDKNLNIIFWQICGEEYAVLDEGDVAKDAIKMPKHSKETPEFDGQCQLNGKDLPYYAVGVLKNEEGATMLPATAAWMIDEKKKKFVPLQTDGLRCSRDGIITADGGK